jgi:hypothetical protein
MANFPVAIQNQPIFNVRNPERTLRSVLSINTPALTFSASSYNLITFVISSPGGNPKVSIETSNDGIYYGSIQPVALTATPTNLSPNTLGTSASPNGTASYQISNPGKFIKITQVNTSNNSHTILNVLLNNGTQASKQQDINIPNASYFSYASPSGGIVNTTPVGIATTALSASYSYLLLSLDLVNAGVTDTEVLIRSNATIGGGSPTVLFRTFLKAGTNQSLRFKPGIKANSTQLMEVVLSTTAIVYVNAQGTQITSPF